MHVRYCTLKKMKWILIIQLRWEYPPTEEKAFYKNDRNLVWNGNMNQIWSLLSNWIWAENSDVGHIWRKTVRNGPRSPFLFFTGKRPAQQVEVWTFGKHLKFTALKPDTERRRRRVWSASLWGFLHPWEPFHFLPD